MRAVIWGVPAGAFIQYTLGMKTRRPVSRVLSTAPLRASDGQSFLCDTAYAMPDATHPGRGPKTAHTHPCLVLLRAGFTMRGLLPAPRWALTPPFHPYSGQGRSGLFSVALSLSSHWADIIRRPVSMEPGLSSSTELPPYQRLPSRLVGCVYTASRQGRLASACGVCFAQVLPSARRPDTQCITTIPRRDQHSGTMGALSLRRITEHCNTGFTGA